MGKEKSEDSQCFAFWHSGRRSKAFFFSFFFFDSFGTRTELYEGIGPGKHPAVMFGGFIICLASVQPTGDCVSLSELFNLYASSCLACEESCGIPMCCELGGQWLGMALVMGLLLN